MAHIVWRCVHQHNKLIQYHTAYFISSFLMPLRSSFYRKYTSSASLPNNRRKFIKSSSFVRIYTCPNKRNLPIVIISGTIFGTQKQWQYILVSITLQTESCDAEFNWKQISLLLAALINSWSWTINNLQREFSNKYHFGLYHNYLFYMFVNS